jgi:hypothetical protein
VLVFYVVAVDITAAFVGVLLTLVQDGFLVFSPKLIFNSLHVLTASEHDGCFFLGRTSKDDGQDLFVQYSCDELL